MEIEFETKDSLSLLRIEHLKDENFVHHENCMKMLTIFIWINDTHVYEVT